MFQKDQPSIGIDCRFAATNSGIGRYTRELVKHLQRREDPWNYVLFTADKKHTGFEDCLLQQTSKPANQKRFTFYSLPTTHYSLGEQLLLPRALRRARVDLFHSPHFNAPLFCRVPLIATIHDLILHQFPNQASPLKHIAYQILMKHTVKNAAALIAVSQATKNGLQETYGEELQRKISVIHEGISEEFQPASLERKVAVRMKYALPEQFFLYVGSAKEHKNVQMLIDACPEDASLILVTGGKEAAALRLKHSVKILSSVPEEDLPALYSSALCFISPSLAEGFNFPVLEAMACGCPVIATNRGSTPEVAGGFATLVEPTEEALRGAMQNPPRGNPEQAMTHTRTFSWKRTAEETAKIYASVLHVPIH